MNILRQYLQEDRFLFLCAEICQTNGRAVSVDGERLITGSFDVF